MHATPANACVARGGALACTRKGGDDLAHVELAGRNLADERPSLSILQTKLVRTPISEGTTVPKPHNDIQHTEPHVAL